MGVSTLADVSVRILGAPQYEAFALALELKADAVLLDDYDARPEALRLGLLTVSTFTIFERAAMRDLIDLPQIVAEMRKTSFRLPSEDDIKAMPERDRLRKEARQSQAQPAREDDHVDPSQKQ